MKKLLIGLMCLLTVAFTTFGLVGCKVQRVESSSTSESNSVEESVPSSEACLHELTVLKQDDVHHWYECSCGDQSGSKEAHVYDDGVVTKNPTEDEEGEKLLTCEVCGASATVTIPKVDHVHALVKIDGTPASCEEDGVMDSWYCEGCTNVYFDADATNQVVTEESLVIPAINHANEAFSHRVAPRCGVAGADVYVCPDCYETREEPIDALEHDWNDTEVVDANCQHGGYTLQTCVNCQNQQKVNETGITDCDEEYVLVSESNCETTGLAKYVCKDCQVEREIILPKCEHEYEAIDTIAATCTEQGYTVYKCKTCVANYKDDLVDSFGGHDYVVDTVNSVDPTCIANGLTVYVCSRGCAGYTEDIDALGHDEVAPTCTEEGYCTRCNDVRVAKLAHVVEEILEDVAPTCTEDGHVTHGCVNCDYSEVRIPENYKAKGHNENAIDWVETEVSLFNTSCQYYVVKSGVCPDCQEEVVREGEVYVSHSYVCAITTPSTCVSEGVKTYTCVCGANYSENYDVDPAAHKMGDGVQEGNYLVYTCQNGGCGHSESVLHIVDEAVDANVVKDAEKLSVGDATLKLDDQTKGQLGEGSSVSLSAGTLAGAELEEAKGKLNEDQLELLGNSEIYNFEMEVDGEAVTQFNGYITIRIPYDLNGQDPEDIVVWYIEGETPVLIEARYIEIDGEGYAEFETNHFSYYSVAKMTPAERCAIYGHYTEGSVTRLPATCLEGGYTLTVCRRCGNKEYTDRVPALGHNWAEVEALHVDVSCTVNGYEKHACVRCQVSYEVKTQAHGHEWVKNDERTVVASCSQEGSVTFECIHCDNEYSITEKKTAHRYNTTVIASTCTTAGYTECVCRDCGYTTIKNPTPALGHNIIDTVHAPTCIERGYTSHVCSRCDEVFANTDYTDVADHEWDKDEPTCEEDKLCKHCRKRDENNGKAKGHYMENGKCKHCSKPCNHTFKYSHTIESTCAGVGYEVWVCKHCQANEYRGETGVASHDFTLLREVAPTCQTAGYKVEICRACGYTQTEETSPVVDHEYANGKCIYCGLVHEIEAGYIDVIQTIKNANGISIMIDEIKFDVYEDVNGVQEIEGKFNSLRAIEFMIYVDENGQIQGAVNGAVQIFNGPVRNGYASYGFKGIIDGDYLYILVEVEDGNNYEMKIKYSVQAVIDSMLDEAIDQDAVSELVESGILEILQNIGESNSDVINAVASKIVSFIFTEEDCVYTLDFDKLRELNNDLAYLSASDFASKYFGEDVLPNAKSLLRQIVYLEINELPEFIEEKGLPADEIFNAINHVSKMQGAPEDYDIRAMLESPEMAGVTVGDLVFGEDITFTEMMDAIEQMQQLPIYLILMGEYEETMVDQVYQAVDQIITMVEGVNVSFITDENGVITEFNVVAEDFVIAMPDVQVELTIRAKFEVNGTIDVTWDGIIGDIEDEIVLPEGLEDEIYISGHQDESWGSIDIDGQRYEYQAIIFNQTRRTYEYSAIAGAAAKQDCGDWIEYALLVPYSNEYVSFGLYAFMAYDEYGEMSGDVQYYFAVDHNIYDRIAVTVDMNTGMLSAYGVNGNLVEVSMEAFSNNNFDFVTLAKQLFGEDCVMNKYSGMTSETVYYNKVTGEYDGESHHNFVLNEENSYEPADCLEEGLKYYECTECGEVYREVYRKYHETEMRFQLSEGATSCEEGIDAYWICTECNEITDYEYNWGYGCHYVYEKVFENGVAKQKDACSACGQGSEREVFTLESDFNLEYYTGKWGKPSNDKPNTGIGGGNVGVEVSREEGFVFKFVPTSDVTVEFYSKASNNNSLADFYASIYNGDFEYLIGERGNLENGHFGIIFTFEAGETYYLNVNNHNFYHEGGTKYTVLFKETQVETLNLSDYGCSCGGEMVITSAFGRKNYQVNVNCGVGEWETCQSCGFTYYCNSEWDTNENCEEVERFVAYFFNENTQESYQYLIYEYKTGNLKHMERSERVEEYYESVDENGNPISVSKEGWTYTCENCNKTISYDVYEYHYNENGERVYYSWTRGHWSVELGECYMYAKTETTYYSDGRTKSNKETYYNEYGEEESWSLVEYVYYAENPCKVTRKYSYSYDKGYESTSYDHWHSEKVLPDESFEEEVWLDGVLVTKRVVTNETYCSRCYASISKSTNVTYTDENGNVVKEEYYNYEQYAESQDVYGWELISSSVNTYGVAKYSFRYFTYLTSEEHVRYFKDSRGQEIESYYKRIYEYIDPTTSCEVIVYNVDRFGNVTQENRPGKEEWSDGYYDKEDGYIGKDEFYGDNVRHIALDEVVLLADGSTSCEDGLALYELCYICGARRQMYYYWNYDHTTFEENAHLDNVEEYHLKDYGQVCNSVIHVVTCPCGVNKEVYFQDQGCDFASYGEWRSDDENKYNHWYSEYNCAVSEPMCGFAYSFEHWDSRGANCARIYNKKWVFGLDSANQLVIEASYHIGDYLHDYESVTIADTRYEEDGLIVYYNANEHVCSLCSHVGRKYEYWYYYSVNANGEETQVKSKQLNTYYYDFGDRIISNTDYYEQGMIVHPSDDRTAWVNFIERHTSYDEYGNETYWSQNTYTYDSCLYTPVTVYENSYGEYSEYQDVHDYYEYYHDGYVITPTCTQSGVEHRTCDWCYASQDYEHSCFGHNYYGTWDEEMQKEVFCCERCGLINFTGYDGNVIMEDMTNAEEGVFTVGYCFYSYFEYIVAVSFVVDGQQDVLNVDAYDDGNSLITVSFDAVRQACGEKGLVFEDIMVKVTILPINGDYSFDYSVTMDSHQNA